MEMVIDLFLSDKVMWHCKTWRLKTPWLKEETAVMKAVAVAWGLEELSLLMQPLLPLAT
ncbi:MAG TPA: hypothetical protein VGG02_00170 [Chthoniobacterales bacterium]|jgi:hypothetical protein